MRLSFVINVNVKVKHNTYIAPQATAVAAAALYVTDKRGRAAYWL